jgi:hypothetical protein
VGSPWAHHEFPEGSAYPVEHRMAAMANDVTLSVTAGEDTEIVPCGS